MSEHQLYEKMNTEKLKKGFEALNGEEFRDLGGELEVDFPTYLCKVSRK